MVLKMHATRKNDIMLALNIFTDDRKYSLPAYSKYGYRYEYQEATAALLPLPSYLNHFQQQLRPDNRSSWGQRNRFGHHILEATLPQRMSMRKLSWVGSNETGFTGVSWGQGESELYSSPYSAQHGELIPNRSNTSGGAPPHLPFGRYRYLLESYSLAESATGSQPLRVLQESHSHLKIRVHNELFIQGEYLAPTASLHDIREYIFFLRPDPNMIIMEPGNTAGAITLPLITTAITVFTSIQVQGLHKTQHNANQNRI